MVTIILKINFLTNKRFLLYNLDILFIDINIKLLSKGLGSKWY